MYAGNEPEVCNELVVRKGMQKKGSRVFISDLGGTGCTLS